MYIMYTIDYFINFSLSCIESIFVVHFFFMLHVMSFKKFEAHDTFFAR